MVEEDHSIVREQHSNVGETDVVLVVAGIVLEDRLIFQRQDDLFGVAQCGEVFWREVCQDLFREAEGAQVVFRCLSGCLFCG